MTNISGHPGTLRSGPTSTRPDRSRNSRCHPPETHQRRRFHPGAPDDRGGVKAGDLVVELHRRPPVVNLDHEVRRVYFAPSRFRSRVAAVDRRSGKVGRMRGPASMRIILASSGVNRAEISLERDVGDLTHRSGQFDPGRSTAHDKECQKSPPHVRVSRNFGVLERPVKPRAILTASSIPFNPGATFCHESCPK